MDKHIPDEDLKKILEAGRLAPSWMNVQSWKFILVKSQENKNLLSELSIGQQQVKNADALIVCIADTNAWEEAKITHIKNPALNPALQCEKALLVRTMEQVIYPISYMMLTANNLGISSCIIGALGSEITGILPELSAKAKETLGIQGAVWPAYQSGFVNNGRLFHFIIYFISINTKFIEHIFN